MSNPPIPITKVSQPPRVLATHHYSPEAGASLGLGLALIR